MSKEDGGYYAIKGFLYQFDKALIEILRNPATKVMVEHRQDIDYQDFVIQVKHKETQEYSGSKIRKPVMQLIDMFKDDQSQRFCLYCHFRDRDPSKWNLTLPELDDILGPRKEGYTLYLKNRFIDNFFVEFSDDYEAQFVKLMTMMQDSFGLPDRDEAFLYHSLFRSKLMDLAIEAKCQREISKRDLEGFIKSTERTVFYRAYAKYLDERKYERLIKTEYFTFKTANLNNFERLFIIECDPRVSLIDLNKTANRLSRNYFRPGKSPQPYLSFRGLQPEHLRDLKRDLVDQGIMFNDGTCFDGDKFRLDKIIKRRLDDKDLKLKIIGLSDVPRLLSKIRVQEIFQFYLDSPLSVTTECSHLRVQIAETAQVLRIV